MHHFPMAGDFSVSSDDESSDESSSWILKSGRHPRSGRSRQSDDANSKVSDTEESLTGREDTKMAAHLRVVVILLFVGMAVSVPAIVYTATRNNQEDSFDTSFRSLAVKVVDSMEHQFVRKTSAIDSLRIAITSYALTNTNQQNASSWPNVLIPDFDLRGESTRELADSLMVAIHPLVTQDTRVAYEAFVADNAKSWINQAYQRSFTYKDLPHPHRRELKEEEKEKEEEPSLSQAKYSSPCTSNTGSGGHATATTAAQRRHGTTSWQEQSSSAAAATPTARVLQSSSSSFGTSPTRNSQPSVEPDYSDPELFLAQQIFRMDNFTDSGLAIDDSPGPFFPFWQHSPVVPEMINYNPLSHPFHRQALLSAANSAEECVISRVDNVNILGSASRHRMEHLYTHMLQETTGDGNATYQDDPLATMYCPIFDSFQDKVQYHPEIIPKKLVAVASTMISFREFFKGVLPSGSKGGIICVVENECDDIFSFRLDGEKAEYKGRTDIHDREFDDMVEVYDFTTTGVRYCPYTLRVYPSIEFRNNHVNKQPIVYSVSMALVVLFISIVSLTYDFYVQRRMKRVLKSAKESRAIVSSLFPANVRDRLFQQEEEMNNSDREKWDLGFAGLGIGSGNDSGVGGGSGRGARTIERLNLGGRRASGNEGGRRSSHSERGSGDGGSNREGHSVVSTMFSMGGGRRNSVSGGNNDSSSRRNSNERDRESGFAEMFPISAAMAGLGAFAQLAPAKMRLKFFLHEGPQQNYGMGGGPGGRGDEETGERALNDQQSDGEDEEPDMVLRVKPIADLVSLVGFSISYRELQKHMFSQTS
jgi:hypothetical protein